jgi:hypothetical protein
MGRHHPSLLRRTCNAIITSLSITPEREMVVDLSEKMMQ